MSNRDNRINLEGESPRLCSKKTSSSGTLEEFKTGIENICQKTEVAAFAVGFETIRGKGIEAGVSVINMEEEEWIAFGILCHTHPAIKEVLRKTKQLMDKAGMEEFIHELE